MAAFDIEATRDSRSEIRVLTPAPRRRVLLVADASHLIALGAAQHPPFELSYTIVDLDVPVEMEKCTLPVTVFVTDRRFR